LMGKSERGPSSRFIQVDGRFQLGLPVHLLR
jgi:hypothetical protein